MYKTWFSLYVDGHAPVACRFATPRAQRPLRFTSRLSTCFGCTTCVAPTVKEAKPPLTHAYLGPVAASARATTKVVISADTSSTVSETILLSQTRRCQARPSCVTAAKGPPSLPLVAPEAAAFFLGLGGGSFCNYLIDKVGQS